MTICPGGKTKTAAAKALSAAHFDAMLDSRKLPKREMLARLMECFAQTPKPFVIR